MWLRLILFLLIVAVALSWHQRNAQPTTLNYFLGEIQLPLSVIVMLALAGGIAIGSLLGLMATVPLRLRAGRLEKRLQKRSRELDTLKQGASGNDTAIANGRSD